MNKPTTQNRTTSLIQLEAGEAWTTSLLVAEKFGKRHDTVLRAIRSLECSSEFSARNFAAADYIDEQSKARPMFRMSRDGFAFLAMGFTGKEAAKWKERFLGAFNAMALRLKQQYAHRSSAEWLEARASGKVVRLEFTDGVQEFVDYAIRQGSTNADQYYRALTKMEYRALFLLEHRSVTGMRDQLNTVQLVNLATAEAVAQRALRDGMAAGMHYKAIYQEAKQRVEALASLIGKSLPGNDMRRLAA